MNNLINKGSLLALCTLCALLAPLHAMAEEPTSTTADPITFVELENGLDLIIIEDHSVPLVTVEIAVKNGAYTEPAEFNGLSHLYEHMFFKSNAVIPSQEAYLQRMRELGIIFNGTTSTERVNYFFTLPSKNFADGLEFMRDAIITPKFDEVEFKKEIQVVLGEVDRNESNPYYWLGQAMDAKIWHAHPTRKDSLGDRKTIETSTVDKMKVMKERYYVPNNSALLIAGDINVDEAKTLAQSMFKDWKASAKDPHETYKIPEHPPLAKSEGVIVNKPVKVPYINISMHGPSVTKDPAATFAADVLSYILAQPTSKFYKTLVESGITYSSNMSYYTQAHTGPISISAQVPPGQIKASIKALLKEAYKLTDPNYFSDEQLESAKQILAIQSIYEREKTSAVIHTVSFWWAVASLDYYTSYVDNLKAVTREDISKYVKDYIINKPFIVGVLSSKDAADMEGLTEASLNALIAEVEQELKAEQAAK